MTRLSLIDPAATTSDRQTLLGQVNQAFGTVPNMFKAVAHSPASLQSMWGAFGALSKGSLPLTLTEQIAVAVADRNACEYCLAAHTALGRQAGVTDEQLKAAQLGESSDPSTAAALRFALQLVNDRGQVKEADVRAVRDAGFNDEQIVEILAHVALNLFTNYVNVAFEVPVDFQAVPLRRHHQA